MFCVIFPVESHDQELEDEHEEGQSQSFISGSGT